MDELLADAVAAAWHVPAETRGSAFAHVVHLILDEGWRNTHTHAIKCAAMYWCITYPTPGTIL